MPEKARDSPVHRLPDWRLTLPLAQSCRRCGARTRSGAKCKAPAMSNGRCRMHGGKSTGPRTSEGLERGCRKELGDNPMHRLPDWRHTLPLAQSCPRCGARTRSGAKCEAPAMQNGRCRMHGGTSTGPRTSEGLERMRQANTRHGNYSEKSRRLYTGCP